MSLKSDLRDPGTPVGAWVRRRFPHARRLYPRLRDTAAPALVIPQGWGNGTDQRWSWAGTAADTMLRWLCGGTGPSDVATSGGWRVADLSSDCDLADLLNAAPPLDDLDHAARVAVVWAMAEQHARYALTENPLTDIGEAPLLDLLAAAPDEVVSDVASTARLVRGTLVADLNQLGSIEVGPAYAYPGGADADLLAGSTLVEVKTTVSRPGLVDVLQPIGYVLLSDDAAADAIAWLYPRSGKMLRLPVTEVLEAAADDPQVTIQRLRDELRELAPRPAT